MHAVVVAWVYYINQTRGVLYSSTCSDLSPGRDVNTPERVFLWSRTLYKTEDWRLAAV